MELNIEIIKEFINLEELHSSKSNPRTYLSVYQGAVEELLKKYLKQQKEIEALREENFDTVYIQAIENYKIKIREKIKEIEENEKGFEYSDRDVIKILEELLEENNYE